MSKKLIIMILLSLILIGGCLSKEDFQKKKEVSLETLFKSGMLITTAATIYRVENGCWPDSTNSLKTYCYKLCEQSKIIDWDNYKIQPLSDSESDKLKIEYHSAKLSYSNVLAFSSDNPSKSMEPIPKEQLCEMFKQLIGIEGQ